MTLMKIRKNYQITIPNSLRKKLNLAIGDYVEIENQDSQIILTPVKLVHPDQEYFYRKEWQAKEAQADKDIAKGDLVGPFDNIADARKALRKAKI